METMSGAKVLVKSLEDLGVDYVFGIPGGAIIEVYNELNKSKVKIITNSNEQCSGFAAAGISRSTEKVGVAIVTSGPAITNTLTSVADCFSDSKPLLVISGQVPEHKIGTDSFQHIDVVSVFGNTAKAVIQISNGNLEEIIKDSYYLAKSGKPGPVVIDFPMDKQTMPMQYSGIPIKKFEIKYKDTNEMSQNIAKTFYELLLKSKKPLLYIGGGLNSKSASKSIREFQNRFKLPFVTTLMAKGVMDERTDYNLGMLGMFGVASANLAVQETDYFIALGARWDDRVASKVGLFGPKAKVAYIDINPEKVRQIRYERGADVCFTGDVTHALDYLMEYAKENKIKKEFKEWGKHALKLKKDYRMNFNKNSRFIQQAEVMSLLNDYIRDNTIITTGVGNHQMFAAQYLEMFSPRSFLTSGSFGTMGFSLPTAIGAQLANKDSQIISIDGDGSLMMNESELHTIAKYNLPIKIIVLNNSRYGMVTALQDFLYGEGNYAGSLLYEKNNFAEIAKAHGIKKTERIEKKEELKKGIESLLSSRESALLEVIVDPSERVYPYVPAGKDYNEMILGPYIGPKK